MLKPINRLVRDQCFPSLAFIELPEQWEQDWNIMELHDRLILAVVVGQVEEDLLRC